jgi:hypothetical protein
MSGKTIKQQLIEIYGPICFLGDIPTDENYLTYHHIKPAREGRETTIENGALLTLKMHWLFNRIESLDLETAKLLNDYFVYYKQTQDKKKLEYMRKFVLSRYHTFIKDNPKEILIFKKKIFTNG